MDRCIANTRDDTTRVIGISPFNEGTVFSKAPWKDCGRRRVTGSAFRLPDGIGGVVLWDLMSACTDTLTMERSIKVMVVQ